MSRFAFTTHNKSAWIGLILHFGLWWAGSIWLWTVGYGWNPRVLLCAAAPVILGPFYLKSLWSIGVVSILSIALLVFACIHGVRTRKTWALVLAHISIIFYWLVCTLLVASQT